MMIDELKFNLEPELIARYPAKNRDESRLMRVDKTSQNIIIEPSFKNILPCLSLGDLIVFNDTKVSKRRVYLNSTKGREHECIFLERETDSPEVWKCILRKSGKLKANDLLITPLKKDIAFQFIDSQDTISRLSPSLPLTEDIFDTIGTVPIPPYLKRKEEEIDNERYQTIFANQSKSVAAPTAGLHFTKELKQEAENKGVRFCPISLHIGYGTFSPVSQKQIDSKELHTEEYTVSPETANLLNQQKKEGKRIISLGTTSLRVLETIYNPETRNYVSGAGKTNIFLMPGDKISSIDALITNFHLPESSLLLLVAAFAGIELTKAAYSKAIECRMRFFSYGDSMMIY